MKVYLGEEGRRWRARRRGKRAKRSEEGERGEKGGGGGCCNTVTYSKGEEPWLWMEREQIIMLLKNYFGNYLHIIK